MSQAAAIVKEQIRVGVKSDKKQKIQKTDPLEAKVVPVMPLKH